MIENIIMSGHHGRFVPACVAISNIQSSRLPTLAVLYVIRSAKLFIGVITEILLASDDFAVTCVKFSDCLVSALFKICIDHV